MNLNFRHVTDGRPFAEWLRKMEPRSGVYVIRVEGEIKYVGESHTDRLKHTIMRHFQTWTGKTAGPTYPKTKSEVAIISARRSTAYELQNAVIAELDPPDNIAGKPKGFWKWLIG